MRLFTLAFTVLDHFTVWYSKPGLLQWIMPMKAERQCQSVLCQSSKCTEGNLLSLEPSAAFCYEGLSTRWSKSEGIVSWFVLFTPVWVSDWLSHSSGVNEIHWNPLFRSKWQQCFIASLCVRACFHAWLKLAPCRRSFPECHYSAWAAQYASQSVA